MSLEIQEAAHVLAEAVDLDTDYWAWQNVAQDSQEAEDSGYLMGYRDALAACDLFIRLGLEEPLKSYVETVKETNQERQREMGGESELPCYCEKRDCPRCGLA